MVSSYTQKVVGKPGDRQSGDTYNNLFDLHFVSVQEGWIVGDFGTVLYTKDGGQTWVNRSEGVGDNSLRGVYFLNARQGWTVSHQGNAYYTRDGGKRWTYQRTNVRYELSDVHFVDENRGWIIGDRRVVLATQDGGRNWDYLTSGSNKRHEEQYGQQLRTGDEPLHTFLLYALHFTDTENGWIVGDLGCHLAHQRWRKDVEASARWGDAIGRSRCRSARCPFCQFSTRLDCWGGFGTIWHTKNGGRTWELQSAPSYLLTDLHFISDKVGYAVGDRGGGPSHRRRWVALAVAR